MSNPGSIPNPPESSARPSSNSQAALRFSAPRIRRGAGGVENHCKILFIESSSMTPKGSSCFIHEGGRGDGVISRVRRLATNKGPRPPAWPSPPASKGDIEIPISDAQRSSPNLTILNGEGVAERIVESLKSARSASLEFTPFWLERRPWARSPAFSGAPRT